jgi:hypothetical protein
MDSVVLIETQFRFNIICICSLSLKMGYASWQREPKNRAFLVYLLSSGEEYFRQHLSFSIFASCHHVTAFLRVSYTIQCCPAIFPVRAPQPAEKYPDLCNHEVVGI